ncbi:EAL domain-containing protein [Oricola sp.]|uniref:putative bifunctional diguanylate cyclase/phosphodiesterase n=1 Tax=Oricola sp. TaxID=1979950 RepID=UPI0025E98DAE|nr:EAL domain-containing protein [Oricola sp.]MCI5076871.1 EAL domain-containing protein [Oricola sp.]
MFGALSGLGFPLTAMTIDQVWRGSSWVPLGDLISSNPVHLIVLTAPLVLGALFAVLGHQHDRRADLAGEKDGIDRNFKLLVQGVTDYAIYMLDTAGHVMSWNAGAERFKGYTADEIIGQHFSRFYGEQDRLVGLPETGLATALRDGHFETEGWRYRKDGTKFWVQVVIDPIFDEAKQHIGFAKITRDRTEQKAAADHLAHLARYDALTGLPNRRHFLEELDICLQNAEAAGRKVAVVNIDLDRFKEINDTHGHDCGDRLLRLLADRISEDLAPGEFIARFGGDEFVAFKTFEFTPELTTFLNTLNGRLRELTYLGDIAILPSGSMGVAIFPVDGTQSSKLIANADLAMYRAKERADLPICYFEPAMDEAARTRRMLASDMRTALEEGQFYLDYQTQHSAETHAVVGYEALLRWNHPTRGLISPAEFIPIAEETGYISPLGEWVVQTACRQAAEWNIAEKIAINISPLQLRDTALIDTVRQALRETGIDPSLIELEVTETAIIGDRHHALHILQQLRATGVTIAIDDFGTGYSSLDTLRSFRFDRIKVDRSFVAGLDMDRQNQAILRAILALGKSLGITVLVEGVETFHQLSMLAREGCDEVQGFLFGRPASLDRVRTLRAGLNPGGMASVH